MPFGLYFDDDSQDLAVVVALREAGVDCHRSGDTGTEGLSDFAHLDFAAERGWVTVTRNRRDYYRLHSERIDAGIGHAGIIIVEQLRRMSIGSQVRAHLALQEQLTGAEMANWVEFLWRWE